MSAGGICHYCKKRDCICEGEAMDKTNELKQIVCTDVRYHTEDPEPNTPVILFITGYEDNVVAALSGIFRDGYFLSADPRPDRDKRLKRGLDFDHWCYVKDVVQLTRTPDTPEAEVWQKGHTLVDLNDGHFECNICESYYVSKDILETCSDCFTTYCTLHGLNKDAYGQKAWEGRKHMEQIRTRPPKPAVSGEGKREETLRNWKANHVSDQSFRVDGTYLPEAVERVWRLIEREKVASYDRHALLTLLAAISESPRPVDSGSADRAREFIANFPNDNYDIDEYFVIAAAAFAEQETATLSTKLATVTAELKEAQEQIKYLANHLGVDYDTETGMYGDGSLKPNVGMLPVEANHPAPQGEEGETK